MANIPLKSIKFPGLDDTYTVPQMDSATGGMGTQGTIPDSKAVKDSIDTLNANLNNVYQHTTVSGTSGHWGYGAYRFVNGGKYTITNNSGGNVLAYTTTAPDSSGTTVETIASNIYDGETITFTASADASAVKIWFNSTGSVVINDLDAKIPKIEEEIVSIEGDITAIDTKVDDNADATEIYTAKSKNLLNPDDLTITGQWYTNGTSHSSDANYKSYANRIPVESSTAYIFSVNGSTNVVMVTLVELDVDGNKVAGSYNKSSSFTTASATKYLLISIDASYATKKVQLEKGSVATAFEAYFTPYSTTHLRTDINSIKSKTLEGKKICAFGDSLAANDNGQRNSNTWVKILADYFGMTAYNRGVGTSCVTDETSEGVARTGYVYVDDDGDAGEVRIVYSGEHDFDDYPNPINPWMCNADRANTIPEDTDIVVIIAGTNDIGTVTLEGFKSAYAEMLNNIITRVPNAKIFPCTMPFQQTYDLGSDAAKAIYNGYRDAIKAVSADYGFECIDLRARMGVNAQNYSDYMNDSTHYATPAGKVKMAECIGSYLSKAIFV